MLFCNTRETSALRDEVPAPNTADMLELRNLNADLTVFGSERLLTMYCSSTVVVESSNAG